MRRMPLDMRTSLRVYKIWPWIFAGGVHREIAIACRVCILRKQGWNYADYSESLRRVEIGLCKMKVLRYYSKRNMI